MNHAIAIIGGLFAILGFACMTYLVFTRLFVTKETFLMGREEWMSCDVTKMYLRKRTMELFSEAFEKAKLRQYNGLRRQCKADCLFAAIIDVDNFKVVNEQFGHLAGDYALSVVAEIILQEIGDKQSAGKYGGDEFLIFINSRKTVVFESLTAILKKIREYEFVWQGQSFSLTVSCGLAELAFEDETQHHLFHRADEALFHVKRNGKDAFAFVEKRNKYVLCGNR